VAIEFYRYISDPAEASQILHDRKIQSKNAKTGYRTWYSPTRYDNPNDAQRELALPNLPIYRIGPIPGDQMPTFDIPLRSVSPAFGQPGLGVEVRTAFPVWLFGLWNFQTRNWEL
jgi:hypothetical protein